MNTKEIVASLDLWRTDLIRNLHPVCLTLSAASGKLLLLEEENIQLKKTASTAGEWTQVPPTQPGNYWQWDGNKLNAPLPLLVLCDGENGKPFIPSGQIGHAQSVDCDNLGGWWMPLNTPALPNSTRNV